MPNIAAVLKDEISRIARKELRRTVDPLRKQVAALRRDNAALKRENAAMRRELSALARRSAARPSPAKATGQEEGGRVRFSAEGLKKMRMKSGLSAASFGKLVGASALSVYHWENGKVRPRADAVARIAALRGKGKRELQRMLGE